MYYWYNSLVSFKSYALCTINDQTFQFYGIGKGVIFMSENKNIKINRTCMEKCKFKVKNCWMDEDGTWDCSTKLEDCFEQCSV